MCLPAAAAGGTFLGLASSTWAGISAATSVVGLGMSAYSSMSQARAQRDSANYNAAVQRNNAQVAEWQAKDSIERGNAALEAHQRKVASLKGSQTASMAARGLSLDEGTPINILSDTDYFGKVDGNTITANAAREAWGYKNQAAGYESAGVLSSNQAGNANPGMAAAGTLISGAGMVADRWYSASGNSKVSQNEMMNLMSDFNDK